MTATDLFPGDPFFLEVNCLQHKDNRDNQNSVASYLYCYK